MKRNLLALVLSMLIASASLKAQEEVSLSMGSGYQNLVYYSLENGKVKETPAKAWEMAFSSRPRQGTNIGGSENVAVLINDNAAVKYYFTPFTPEEWDAVSLEGKNEWVEATNDLKYWHGGFLKFGGRHPEYGWGIYNMTTHDLNGTNIIVLEMEGGEMIKVLIEKLEQDKVWHIKYAKIGEGVTKTVTLDKADYKDKNFVGFSFSNNEVVDFEPPSTEWDFVLTKYKMPVAQGPEVVYYPSVSVMLNVSRLSYRDEEAATAADAEYDAERLHDSIATIGADWKTFDRGSGEYNLVDNHTYFVEDLKGNVYRVHFTEFEGTETGNMAFMQELVLGNPSSLPNLSSENLNVSIYPNPSNGIISVENKAGQTLSLEVMSLDGRSVLSIDRLSEGRATVDLLERGLGSGLYVVRLSTADRSYQTRILVR